MVHLKYRLKKNTADRIFSVFFVLLFDFFVQIPTHMAPRHSIGSTEAEPLRYYTAFLGESSL